MRTKVIVLAVLLCLFQALHVIAQDTLVKIASQNIIQESGELLAMEHAFFDAEMNDLFFSFNQQPIPATTEAYSVQFEIKKKSIDQDKHKPLLVKTLEPNHKNTFLVDSFHIANLYSGNFILVVTVRNAMKQTIYKSVVPFQVYHPGNAKIKTEYLESASDTQHAVSLKQTFVEQYSLKQLRINIAALMPIARGAEVTFIRGVEQANDQKVLQLFFYNFWLNRDASNPEKAWKLYTEKLNFVAKTYGNAQEKGYETDRGRIYINYGHPDKLERCLQEKNARPYEVWFYYSANGRNNVKFLFVQPGMLSNQFILLHSTETDELVNPNWRSSLFLTNSTNDKENRSKHRVFQYFQ